MIKNKSQLRRNIRFKTLLAKSKDEELIDLLNKPELLKMNPRTSKLFKEALKAISKNIKVVDVPVQDPNSEIEEAIIEE